MSDAESADDDPEMDEPLIKRVVNVKNVKSHEPKFERDEMLNTKRQKRKFGKNVDVPDIKTKIKKETVSDVNEEMNEPFGNLTKLKRSVKTKMKDEKIKYEEKSADWKKEMSLDEMNKISLEAKKFVPKVKVELISKNADSAKVVKTKKAKEEKQEERRNQLTNTRKLSRNTKIDGLRKNNENQAEMTTFSPEDFDDDVKYNLPGVKRRRLSVPVSSVQKSLRKIIARKYKNVVKRGDGLERKFIPYSENIVYEYYDDPNELCDRLRLLVSSKSAGNTNHDQEINSIIEELRERDIVV